MSEWEWQCISCGADMGPVVGKHAAKCPECGCMSVVCIPAPGEGEIRESDKLSRVLDKQFLRLGDDKCHVLRCTVVRQECDDWQRYEMECGNEFMWQVQDAPVWCPYCGGRIVE